MSDEMDEAAGKENRRDPRFRLNLGVTIRLSCGEFTKGIGVNISIGGIYVEYGAPADEGTVFDLCFDLTFSQDIKRVFARGKVVRSILIGGKDVYGLAFVFESFAKDTELVLEEYIEYRSRTQSDCL
jgi:hypothetical protein